MYFVANVYVCVCYCFVMISNRWLLHHLTICISLKPVPNNGQYFFSAIRKYCKILVLTLNCAFVCVFLSIVFVYFVANVYMCVCYCFVMISNRWLLHHLTICISLKPVQNIGQYFFIAIRNYCKILVSVINH